MIIHQSARCRALLALLALASAWGLSGTRANTWGPRPANDAPTCDPLELEQPTPVASPSPPLPEGQRPNFIIIMTDDQGYDDVGVHNPGFVNSPNIDSLFQRGTSFDNYYTAPECAQTRASLLTGRHFARTGTMLVSGGYDFINREEVTAGEFMAAAGYTTAHFGKWHNGQTLNYEPWNVGFNESWWPATRRDNGLFAHNGIYEPFIGNMEAAMVDRILAFMTKQQDSGKPFFLYWAPYLIHFESLLGINYGPDGQPFVDVTVDDKTRLVPPEILAKYTAEADPRYAGVPNTTLEAWATVEFFDQLLGRVLDFLAASPLGHSTYVMLTSDNGAAVLGDYQYRAPSRMQGGKHSVLEGGVRNFLAVTGPGVPGGVVDSTLLDATDILPTMADLAGISPSAFPHMPWDGISFRNLLLPGRDGRAGSGRRGDSLASAEQLGRYVVSMSPYCWSGNAVPALGLSREVLRPQPLLNYDTGGLLRGPTPWQDDPSDGGSGGFQQCLGVRWGKYKWLGRNNKVFEFNEQTGSHVELACNAVQRQPFLSRNASAYARAWWDSVVAEPHSFTKPVFFLGLNSWTATNVIAAGAYERTPDNVGIRSTTMTGFQAPGDRACWSVRVLRGGTYDVVVMYSSFLEATFRLSLGDYADIASGSAPSRTFVLPRQPGAVAGVLVGYLTLTAPRDIVKQDACLELLSSSGPAGRPVMQQLVNIRLVLGGSKAQPASLALSRRAREPAPSRSARAGASIIAESAGAGTGAAAAAAGGGGWLRVGAGGATALLNKEFGWPDGQLVMESMFSMNHE